MAHERASADPGPTHAGAGAEEVLATDQSQRRMAKLLSPLYAVMGVMQLVLALTEDDPGLYVALSAAFLLFAGGYLYFGYARSAPCLVLTADTLELRRPFRPVVVRRDDVLAVRASIEAHPSWSDRVLLETEAGVVKLPKLNTTVPKLIARLEPWAGAHDVTTTEGPRPLDGGGDARAHGARGTRRA